MRPQVILFALLCAGLIVGFAFHASRHSRAVLGPVSIAYPAAQAPAETRPPASNSGPSAPALRAIAPRPVEDIAPATTENAVAIGAIVADLEKPDPVTRREALQRARDLGDRAIVPQLRQIAAYTSDAEEKAAILDTIDFLNLPSLDENVAAAMAARGAAKPVVRKE